MRLVNVGGPLVFESEEYLLSWGSKALAADSSKEVVTVPLAPGSSFIPALGTPWH